MTEQPTHRVVEAAIAMRCRRETMKRGRSCLILMRYFSTMVTPTLKSTDGAVSHWKYTIGNVIAYRDMYRADLRGVEWTARYFRVARYLLTAPRGAYPAWRLLFGVRRVATDDMDLYSLWGARPSGRKRGRNSCGAFTNRNLRFALTAGARVANALTSPSQILKGV
jgi:hypothetical protein